MSPRIVLTFAAASTALLTTACGGDRERTAESVVAAFYPLAYAAQQVAPEADVANLTPAGAEPHDLELTPRDVERLRAADRVFYVGGGFMPALENVVGESDNAVDVLAGLQLLEADATIDPHVWLDPLRYAQVAARMAEELGRPEAAQALVDRLEALDEEIRAGLASCERREIVTSHAAYGYLADAYDLEQIALTGVSPEAEPSPRAIEELVAEVEATGATTVFFETLVAPDLAETVAREAGARTAALNPLEGLTEDELEAGADYFAVMHENLAVLRTALACR
jgi:zinc transport system substrate-binding protein